MLLVALRRECVYLSLPRGTQVKFKTELARDLGEAMGVPSRRFSVETVNGKCFAVLPSNWPASILTLRCRCRSDLSCHLIVAPRTDLSCFGVVFCLLRAACGPFCVQPTATQM